MALSNATGVSGHEAELTQMVADRLAPLADDVRRDSLGNCVAVRRGERPAESRRFSVMLAAHMDEIGMVVSRVEKGGFLRVSPIGGTNVQTLMGQDVIVHTQSGPRRGVVGLKPPHLTTAEERRKFPRWGDLFVDLGLEEDELRQVVNVGDTITVMAQGERLAGELVTGKALDNRASVAVLASALEQLQGLRHRADVYVVATVQEEVGLRGAMVSTFALEPDLGVAVDVTFARQRQVTDPDVAELGKGPVIARGANMHPRIVERLLETARRHGIAYQVEVIPGRSGTDAWAMQVTRAGVASALVSVPQCYMHSAVEIVHLDDIRGTGRLLAHFIAGLDEGFVRGLSDWGVTGRDE